MRFLLIVFISFALGCAQGSKNSETDPSLDTTKAPGAVSVFQTATSANETTINILRPHLAHAVYELDDPSAQLKKVKTTRGKHIHWVVDRLHITKLQPGKVYRLNIYSKSKYGKKLADWRQFTTFDPAKKKAKFVVGSCMSDSFIFSHIIPPMWERIRQDQPDFLVLLGDQVYVDDFSFVKREKATELDIWRRFIDSFRKIPVFQQRRLIPIFAIWDDHDYGTNNSDKTFISKKAARKIFNAFFGGENIKGAYEKGHDGVYAYIKAFNQQFFLMDDRYFREPSGSSKPHGHWGKRQQSWLLKKLSDSSRASWIANGGQIFAEGIKIKRKNGTVKQINESLLADHPKAYEKVMAGLKKSKAPIAFLSGDIHFSEILKVPSDVLGYETYEITSSPLHSYIFRARKGQPEFWPNPRRIKAIKEYNYVLVESDTSEDKQWKIRARSFGVKQKGAFFDHSMVIQK